MWHDNVLCKPGITNFHCIVCVFLNSINFFIKKVLVISLKIDNCESVA